MLFSSSVFLAVFLPVVLLVYHGLLRGRRGAQNVFLLLASLFFYWWGEPKFVLIMLLSIAMNYLFGLWAGAFRERGIRLTAPVVCTVAANLAILFSFKYVDFTVRNLNLLGLDLTPPEILLPIGISFYTFQAMSYVFDIAQGRGTVQKNPLNVGLYIALFPQLVAGPIVKYETVAREILHRRETWDDFAEGVRRFLIGLGKKVLLSNQLAVVADLAFAAEAPTASLAWLGAICYTLQIYYDFSGYSDMAIGLGRLFGFDIPANFDHPYTALSVQDFWRRWHIALSSWLSNQLAVVADLAFAAEAPTASLAWLGAICYTLQIYYDFSGYSDMAIGLGRMFGFHFLENFNWPYVSRSITEFWRRWHISLSTWFRDYVYFPLGGSRVDRKWKLLRNLLVVWLLTGIWHGANWTFIAWGMLYFALLVLEKFCGLGRGWPAWLGHGYTLLMVNFAWVLFRAEDLGAAARYLAAMFGANGWVEPTALFWAGEQFVFIAAGLFFAVPTAGWLREKVNASRLAPLWNALYILALLAVWAGEQFVFIAAGLFFAVPTAGWLREKVNASRLAPLWNALYILALLAVFAVSTALLVKGTYNPFIYFNF